MLRFITCLIIHRLSWRQVSKNHIIFLQNLATGHVVFPDELNDKVNHYLLRAIDSTTVTTKSKMCIYAKLGPIAFFTTLKPDKMKKVIEKVVKTQNQQL